MLRLEIPNTSHEKEYNEMIKEWWKFENIKEVSPWALFRWDNFQEFLEIAEKDITDNDRWVPATLFFLMEDQKILWAIQIRHHINHPNLRNTWWHIGYGIRPSARKKWYGKKQLSLWLWEAKNLWLSKVMISCLDWNEASTKIIEQNGGVFEKIKIIESTSSHRSVNRGKKLRVYWITL